MAQYSLIESKLRRYFYLGHEHSIYIPYESRKKFWEHNPQHLYYLTGVRIIGKIINKNNPEEINSIVPIILKVKKENKILNDKYLIFALAVCAKFNLIKCQQMVSDAYNAVLSICTNGLKLLMFLKFCHDVNIILYNEGYISDIHSGYGNGFRKAIEKWYLSRDPLQTTEQIVTNDNYNGWNHQYVLRLFHITSDDPSRQIFIIYTTLGMKKVEEMFKSYIEHENDNETLEDCQAKFVYHYLKKLEEMKTMTETALIREIELRRWGHEYKVIPPDMLEKPAVLGSLVIHMPLRDVLDMTFYFAKQKLFVHRKKALYDGLTEYMLRFENSRQLQIHHIHPIESYLEFVKYSRTFKSVHEAQYDIFQKKRISKFTDEHNTQNFTKPPTKMRSDNYSSSLINNTQVEKKRKTRRSSDKNKAKITKILPKFNSKFIRRKSSKKKRKNKEEHQVNQSKPTMDASNTHSTPKLVNELVEFLSQDLIIKSLKILKPTNKRILIAYDNRKQMLRYMCASTPFLKVHEAITLITLSLIFPENELNKPTVIGINEARKVKIEYGDISTFKELENILYKEKSFNEWDPDFKQKLSIINPLSIMTSAKEQKEKYDVFVFLGITLMNYRLLDNYIKEYKQFVEKRIKVIICCLNGKHRDQRNLSRNNMLFISGFDKNVGKIIHSFINDEF